MLPQSLNMWKMSDNDSGSKKEAQITTDNLELDTRCFYLGPRKLETNASGNGDQDKFLEEINQNTGWGYWTCNLWQDSDQHQQGKGDSPQVQRDWESLTTLPKSFPNQKVSIHGNP